MSQNDDLLIERAVAYLRQARRAVALTGAGISTPSGIPDFRSPGSGLWEKFDPMMVASIEAFQQRPQDFYDWIHPLAELTLRARPNPAHIALADLEARGPLRAIITQNIDMLHSRAGSTNVYEVHGHLRQAICVGCGMVFEAEELLREFVYKRQMPTCVICDQVLKPTITLFGEIPPLPVLQMAEVWAATCDLLLVAGSSLGVYPVSELPLLAKQNGARLIIVNYTETYADPIADVVIHSNVADVLPRLAAPFLAP